MDEGITEVVTAVTLLSENETFVDPENRIPPYLRVISCIFFIGIFIVGVVGNAMVAIVISTSKDMRTSTNIFLINLSIADLLLLLICTPTVLVEILYHPDIWILGPIMCKLVPMLEVTVYHASGLTILAISFERYYAICCPLKANYVCTRTRAICINVATWFTASLITSPIYFIMHFIPKRTLEFENVNTCIMEAGSFWPDFYWILSIVLFFILPLVILLITYGIIAKKLTMDRSELNAKNENLKGRKQVVLMLGTVVFTFFLCLLPYRVLTLIIISTDNYLSPELLYNLIYFSRIMTYMNSALNPILYNIMSSKFRNGFLRLCGRRPRGHFQRNGTLLTMTTTTSANGNFSMALVPNHYNTSPELGASIVRKNGVSKLDQEGVKKYFSNGSRKDFNGKSNIGNVAKVTNGVGINSFAVTYVQSTSNGETLL